VLDQHQCHRRFGRDRGGDSLDRVEAKPLPPHRGQRRAEQLAKRGAICFGRTQAKHTPEHRPELRRVVARHVVLLQRVNCAVGLFHHREQIDDLDQAMAAQLVELTQDLPLEPIDPVEGEREQLNWPDLHSFILLFP